MELKINGYNMVYLTVNLTKFVWINKFGNITSFIIHFGWSLLECIFIFVLFK